MPYMSRHYRRLAEYLSNILQKITSITINVPIGFAYLYNMLINEINRVIIFA